MNAECVCCGRPTPDGWACQHCADRAVAHLEEIERLTPDARQVAYGLARRGDGGASGKPGSRSPGNDEALDALAAVQNALTTLARDIAETRGTAVFGDAWTHPDPLTRVCSWLSGQMEWVRHAVDAQGGPYAEAAFAEIEDCARRMRWIVDGPAPKKYLGPCGALLIAPAPPQDGCDCGHEGLDSSYHLKPCPIAFLEQRSTCEGDVYGPAGGKTGTCRTCGAQVDQSERREWLDDQVRSRAYRAVQIEEAYGIKAKTILSWRDRGQLVAHGFDGYDHRGLPRPTFNVGDVLDLHEQALLRRAENEARRNRRQESAA